MAVDTINAHALGTILIAAPLDLSSQLSRQNLPVYCDRYDDVTNLEEHFLEECYAEPHFLIDNGKKSYSLTRTKDDDSKKNTYYDDEYRGKLISEYNNFQSNLIGSDTSGNSVFSRTMHLIIGTAGCGKTTFASKLLLKRNNIYYERDDFANANSDIVNFITPEINFRVGLDEITPINCLKLILTRRIGKLFLCNKNLDHDAADIELRESVKCIAETYKKHFNLGDINDLSVYRDFFNNLAAIAKPDATEPGYMPNKLYELVKHVFDIHCDSLKPKWTEEKRLEKQSEKQLEYLIGLFLRISFCAVKSLAYYNGKKILLFIDNIERALTLGGLRNRGASSSDIKIILNSVYKASFSFNQIMANMRVAHGQKPDAYETTVAILLNMRDSTYGILEIMEKEGDLSNIDHYSKIRISGWFSPDEILCRRITYYLNSKDISALKDLLSGEKIKRSSGVEAYFNITSDKGISKWSLSDFLESFYAGSKRHIAERFVQKLLSGKENSNHLDIFNRLCNISFDKVDDATRNAVINLRRKYIIRLMLDFVKDAIKTNVAFYGHTLKDIANDRESGKAFPIDNEYHNLSASYARRIVTFLSENMKPDEINYKFFKTNDLIDKLVMCDENIVNSAEEEKKLIDRFSDVLFGLNEMLSNDTNWTALVCIEIKSGSTFTQPELTKMIYSDWEKHKNKARDKKIKKGKVSVRATDAGSIYALLMPDFEYFASRYNDKELPPLLTCKRTSHLKQILNDVKVAAFRCIEHILKTEAQLNVLWRYKDDTGTLLRHESRIINHHIGYLCNYAVYVKSNISKLFESQKVPMLLCVLSIISDYIKFASDKGIAYELHEQNRKALDDICKRHSFLQKNNPNLEPLFNQLSKLTRETGEIG